MHLVSLAPLVSTVSPVSRIGWCPVEPHQHSAGDVLRLDIDCLGSVSVQDVFSSRNSHRARPYMSQHSMLWWCWKLLS
ncbi:hypothetical protein E2C01_085749 [Portunus trituberculatus]|uniref:Uncharacterized protein n=1 Tax=Portunus trituberculatus TaxID=210409 RepID=A0A5B7IYY6_PORTR|nr:hypothetical protein [Portunus trituberculatus]